MFKFVLVACAALLYLIPAQATAALNTDAQTSTSISTKSQQSLHHFVDDGAELIDAWAADVLDEFLINVRLETGIEIIVQTMEYLDNLERLNALVEKDAPERLLLEEPIGDKRILLTYVSSFNAYVITVGAGLRNVITKGVADAIIDNRMRMYADTKEHDVTVNDDFGLAFMSAAFAIDGIVRQALKEDVKKERSHKGSSKIE